MEAETSWREAGQGAVVAKAARYKKAITLSARFILHIVVAAMVFIPKERTKNKRKRKKEVQVARVPLVVHALRLSTYCSSRRSPS